jgi:copper resistance protein C
MRILVVAIAVLLAAGLASAHAFLDRASPAVGATVAAPKEISIWFTEQVEPAFSAIEVTDAAGNRVDRGGTHPDPANRMLLHVALKPLTPGAYKVKWHVVSVDTHRTQGDFGFTVAP